MNSNHCCKLVYIQFPYKSVHYRHNLKTGIYVLLKSLKIFINRNTYSNNIYIPEVHLKNKINEISLKRYFRVSIESIFIFDFANCVCVLNEGGRFTNA